MKKTVKGILASVMTLTMASVGFTQPYTYAADSAPLYDMHDAENIVLGEESFVSSFVSDNAEYPYVLHITVTADSTAIIRFDVPEDVREQLHDTSNFGLFTFSARQFYEENFDGNEYQFSYAGGSSVHGADGFNEAHYDVLNDETDPYLPKLTAYTLRTDVDTIPNEFVEALHAGEDTEFFLRITPTYNDTKLAAEGDFYQLHVGGKTYEVMCQADEDGKLSASITEVSGAGEFDFDSYTAPHLVELGDANGDGLVDIIDVITTNKIILGSERSSEDTLTAVDFNRNGIDPNDSLNLLKYVVELVDKGYLEQLRSESL